MAGRALILVLSALLAGCAGSGDETRFATLDTDLRAAGKLRADRNPADVTYTQRDLLEHFGRIGFGSEFEIVDGRYRGLDTDPSAPLTRWTGPVRYALMGAPEPGDGATVAAFTERLARATGLDFARASDSPNLLVFFLDRQGRARVAETFRTTPRYAPLSDLFGAWAGDSGWPCAAEFYYRPAGAPSAHAIYFAVVYIRAEVAGLSRQSCIEEEMAQAMGLARDDPALRPSIFNDDEEFALMTDHDAALLSLLYDPRLEPGMTADEALPVARRVLGLAD